MEFDRDNLPASIDVAEKAIHQRFGDCRLHTLSDLAERLEMAPLKRLRRCHNSRPGYLRAKARTTRG
jgi:hypothetical protein